MKHVTNASNPRRRPKRTLAGLTVGFAATAGIFGVVHAPSAPALVSANIAQAAKPANPLPAVSVTDIRTGRAVALQSAMTGKKPLLVWFWAPH